MGEYENKNLLFLGVDDNTELYRYMTLPQFMAIIENRSLYLPNISDWEDTWEAALLKTPTQISGKTVLPSYSSWEDMHGQCWTLSSESDALWRIYSPNREGIMVKTTAKKFKKISEFKRALLGKVRYTDFSNHEEFNGQSDLELALYKRKAFIHEQEVRLLTSKYMILSSDTDTPAISVNINPFEFIEEIVIDPRAKTWFVDIVQKYCSRAGFEIIPKRSALYEFDRFNSLNFIKVFIPRD
ncbi:DUF2971 domain-containing protein [Brevibacillus centrosporus]|uniref:DUF2971 domain-containing protein n=1 Tax=Brevibacillus centrosporus TaxID=54910 RepID=UPI003B02E8E7